MPTLTFKVSPEEARAIRSKARAERATVSAFLRTRALDAPLAPGKSSSRNIPSPGCCMMPAASAAHW
jgi:hypothetical protein